MYPIAQAISSTNRGFAVFATALLAIAIQALKAARRNPVNALRYE